MNTQFWHNATKSDPCPICHKPDWCNLANDGSVVICHRIESPHPAKGGGWLHRLKEVEKRGGGGERGEWRSEAGAEVRAKGYGVFAEGLPEEELPARRVTLDFARVHASYDNDAVLLDGLALELGVEAFALKALDVRFNHMDSCWSFPMRDASGKIVGLRYRELGGSRKWSARGSRDGLFYDPEGTCVKTLYITEGASDTAAALSLGLVAIGRSSCTSGTPLIKELLARLRPSSLAIIADNDAPGLAGARALSQELGNARIITPPKGYKDLREWSKKR